MTLPKKTAATTGATGRARRRHADERGLLCDPGASDQVLLRAVVDHYVVARRTSAPARRWLDAHGLSAELADMLSLGFADRSLGAALPEANRVAGHELRRRLTAFGVLRTSGHQHLLGCMIVPILESGLIVGLYGIPVNGRGEPRFAEGLPGGTFTVAIAEGEPVACESMLRALELAATGTSAVVRTQPNIRPESGAEQPSAVVTGESVQQDVVTEPDGAGRIDLVAPGEALVHFPDRAWRVRGASRQKGYESLRVNLSVTDSATGSLHLDALDLYSSRARSSFVRSAASELRADTGPIGRELARVLFAAEQAAELPPSDDEEIAALSDTEQADAMALLTDPKLIERITADVAALGVVGEEDNALILYLAGTSRLARRPLGVVVQSSSAAGKSTLAEAVLGLMPVEDTVSLSALSTQALYYLGPDTLKHKVLFIAEEEGASRASYALKLLQSEGKVSIATAGKDARSGRITTTTSEVIGPVALVMTTTSMDLDDELANRLVALTVDETAAQTRAVLDAQRRALAPEALAQSTIRERLIARHRNAQSLLRPMAVVIPDPSRLHFGESTTRARRDHAKYLALICASALLHQFQRPQRRTDVEGQTVDYIEATDADIALADRLGTGVLMRDASELPPGTEALLRELSAWAGTAPFTRRSAREALGLGDTQLKVHLRRLVELEYITTARSHHGVWYSLCWSDPQTERARGTDGAVTNTKPTASKRSGTGRGVVGAQSGSGRGRANGANGQLKGQNGQPGPSNGRKRAGAGVRVVTGDIDGENR
jgi:hypothetical protein